MSRITLNDRWLWSQIVICECLCKECGDGKAIVITKGKETTKLIKILQKLNYKGMKKGVGMTKDIILREITI